MSDPAIDREIEQNERRNVDERDERDTSVTATVEDAVSSFARPLANARPSAEDTERQREANDAEQRGEEFPSNVRLGRSTRG